MKISLNWMKWYGGQGLDAPIDELVERIGAQLGAVEEVENLGEKYQGVVVARVVSCEDHPDADRLHVCTIDDGGITPDVKRDTNGHVQVVCGAPNVREGLLVAWLPPGSTVPESVGKEPFVLEARELRGVVSNGMLASPKELALGDSHDGILEIDEPDAKPGDDFAKVYGLDDYIIDIENKMFTHRPDCFGQLGVAREIAGISGLQFVSPDWYLVPKEGVLQGSGSALPLEVKNELPALVPRFVAISLSNISVKPSPVWIQAYLQRVGVRPINNVVDITNYMMLLTGQPMHAYDYDKLKALDSADRATIIVRQPRESEKLELLNGKTIDPRQEAIMIASANKLIGIGGVMGGVETEVSDDTKNIVLEAATFDMYSVRRTSMAHGLFTDAVTRFNKGQSPLQNEKLAAKAVQMLQELAGAKVEQVVDESHVEGREWVHPPVPVTAEFINTRLGFNLSADDMKKLLENVEFKVDVDDDKLTVTAPFWRTDVETREDVVEEVGRLYGFDHLPLELPLRSVKPVQKDPMLELKSALRHQLARNGANELLTYSFVHGDLIDKAGQDKAKAFSLSNALSPDLQYYRLSLTPSLLTAVHPNIKGGYSQFGLFELGKAHVHGEQDPVEPAVPKEINALAFVYAAQKAKEGAAYYHAKRQLHELLRHYQIESRMRLEPLDTADLYNNPWLEQMVAPYDPKRSAILKQPDNTLIWGIVGEFKASVKRALKLPQATAGFELDPMLFSGGAQQIAYLSLPKFPGVWQDLTLKVTTDQPFDQLHDLIDKVLGANAPVETLVQFEDIGVYQSKEDSAHKNVTFRIRITGLNRTLTDKEVGKTVEAIAVEAKQKLGAEQV
jgi:phenylalanyl-tRNA synthetase beta chain